MVFIILGFFAFAWLFAALIGMGLVLDIIDKFKDIGRVNLPPKYKAAMRQDYDRWSQKQFIIGALVHFPSHIVCQPTYLFTLGLLLRLQRLIGLPDSVIEFYRHRLGKWVWWINFNTIEDFNGVTRIKTPLIIGNHCSEFDALYKVVNLPTKASFVAKKENSGWSAFRAVGQHLKFIYFERKDIESRRATAQQIQNRIRLFQQDSVNNFPVVIYPQGTGSNGRGIFRFKRGAFQAMVPLTLISMRYQCSHFDVACDEIEDVEHFLMTYCMRPVLRVKYYETKPYEGQSVDESKERCRLKLAEMGGMYLCNSRYPDAAVYWRNIWGRMAQRRKMG